MAELADLVRTIAASADPQNAYRAVERTYSSHEALYPIGGRKKNLDGPWGQKVVDRAEPLISHNDADIKAMFADFETLRSMGISGMINIPIMADGVVIGSVNISGDEGQFSEADVPALTVLANLLAPALQRYQ